MEFVSEEQMLRLKRASVWAELYVAGRSLEQISDLFIVSIVEVRKTLWEAGFNFVESAQNKKAIWKSGFPALTVRMQLFH